MIEVQTGSRLAALSCGKPVYLVILLAGPDRSPEAWLELATGWAPAMIKADFLATKAQNWAEPDAAEALDAFLDIEMTARRIPDGHVALVGAGAGARLAAQVGLSRAERLAAVVAFEGDFTGLPATSNTTPLLLISEGEDAAAFKSALKQAGAPVWSFRPREASEGVDAAGAFLARHVQHVRKV